MEERLKRQLDFALEIDKEKNIFRQTTFPGHGRNERCGAAGYGDYGVSFKRVCERTG